MYPQPPNTILNHPTLAFYRPCFPVTPMVDIPSGNGEVIIPYFFLHVLYGKYRQSASKIHMALEEYIIYDSLGEFAARTVH